MTKILGCLIRLFILIVIIMAIIIGWIWSCADTPFLQKIDKTEPDRDTAPYSIPTITWDYYAFEAVENEDGSVTIRGEWYIETKEGWEKQEGEFTIPAVLRPEIKLR